MTSPLDVELTLSEDEIKALITDLEPSIQKILQRADDPNWKPYKKKKGYEVFWMKTDESPVITIKSEGIIDATVQEVADFLKDFEKVTPVVDVMYMEGKTMAHFGDHTINYAAYKMPPLITTRDFLMHTIDTFVENGVAISIGKSIVRPEVPDRPGCVRALLNPSGYVYKPYKDDPSKTFMQYIVNVDVKGWIPHWVVNVSAADQGENVRRVQEYFSKTKKGAK